MPSLISVGKLLIFLGLVLIVVGGILVLLPKIPWLGRLPGDFFYRGEKFSFYFPLATSLLISVLLTLLFALFRR
jgi:hypothetical protein